MLTFNRIRFTAGLAGYGVQVVRNNIAIDTTTEDGVSVEGQVFEATFDTADIPAPAWAGNYPDPQPDPPQPDPPPTDRRITVFAFRARFTTAEKIAIETAAQGVPTASASDPRNVFAMRLRASEKDLQAARNVDLDMEATREGTMALGQVGILAAGRALEILDAPVQDHERA